MATSTTESAQNASNRSRGSTVCRSDTTLGAQALRLAQGRGAKGMCRTFVNFYIAVLVLAFATLLAAGCSGSETAQEEEGTKAAADKPNIIFFIADDLDYASAQKMPEIGS